MDENEVVDQSALNGLESRENQEGDPGQVQEGNGPALFEETDDLVGDDAPAEGEENREPEGRQFSEAETLRFKKMRQGFNDALKEKRRLERELEEARAKLPKQEPELGPKPTLDQYDYDETRFAEAYDKWAERRDAMNRSDQQKLDAQRKEQEEINNFRQSYAKRSESLGVQDFKETEAEVGSLLSQTQTGLLMRGADDPASLVYALGKSPERLVELSKITDPVKFTVAVAKMEINLNSTRKPSKPAPEARISSERSSSSISGGSALEKLREEAARTGDYSKVVDYKRKNGIT